MSRVLPIVCAATVLAAPAFAHHSRAPYDLTKEVTFEGVVAEVAWKNPHIYFTVETKGPDGKPLLQEIEAMSVSEARGLGLPREAIAAGARVVVRARPGRGRPGARALGLTVATGDGGVLPLNIDAGIGAAPPPAAPAQGIAGRWAPPIAETRKAAVAGRNLPMTSAAREEFEKAMSDPRATTEICVANPPPTLAFFPDFREIVVGEEAVTLRFEGGQGLNVERVVRLEPAHPADVEPSLLGDSIGRWEGETLVIDTVAFTPHHRGLGGRIPSGSRKHLVERLTLTEDRQQLRYEVTLEDPDYLTELGTYSMLWDHRPDLEPSDEACDPEAAAKYLEEAEEP